MEARAEELRGDLGRAPHTRVDTVLLHLAHQAGNLIEFESLRSDEEAHAARPLIDDCAPVDVLAAGG